MTAPSGRTFRLLIDDTPLDGPTNMARDEILLEQADRYNSPTIRWYQWAPATLSLGYFQSDDPTVLPALPRVRRLSGGGAIVHDAEYTYAIAAPRTLIPDVRGLYTTVHKAIVDVLRNECQFEIGMRGVDNKAIDGEFLCFARGDRHDIVTPSQTKIVGSAQRRRGSAVLQHGSVATAVGIPSLDETHHPSNLKDSLTFPDFVGAVTERLKNESHFETIGSDWSREECDSADEWARLKYDQLEWTVTLRRGPKIIPKPPESHEIRR